MFADDICLFSPNLVGFQNLLNPCYSYALSRKMLFNCSKLFGMLFAPKNFNLSSSPKILIDNSEISFVQSVKYLGLHINSDLNDDIDIQRQVKSPYCAANKLKHQFSKCSLEVKTIYFNIFACLFMEATCVIIVNITSDDYVLLTMILIEFCTIYLNMLVLVTIKIF